MRLTFENKMSMAIQKSLEDGEKLGGIPKSLIMSATEATELVSELNRLHMMVRDDIVTRFSITSPQTTSKGNVHQLGAEIRWTLGRVPAEKIPQLVAAWKGGAIKVTTRYVPSPEVGERSCRAKPIHVPLIIEEKKEYENPGVKSK